MPRDQTVTVFGDARLAEYATRMVFGEDANKGPQREAPAPLLELAKAWPVATDMPVKLALHLPVDFDVSKEMARGERKGVVLVINRVTILHQGKAVGYAIRTDEPGLNALDLYDRTWKAWLQRLGRAH